MISEYSGPKENAPGVDPTGGASRNSLSLNTNSTLTVGALQGSVATVGNDDAAAREAVLAQAEHLQAAHFDGLATTHSEATLLDIRPMFLQQSVAPQNPKPKHLGRSIVLAQPDALPVERQGWRPTSMVGAAVDFDEGDLDSATLKHMLQVFLGDAICAIYSTASSRPNDKRWRAVIPFNKAVSATDWLRFQKLIAVYFEQHGITLDVAMSRISQFCLLPTVTPENLHPAGTTDMGFDISGTPLHFEHLYFGRRLVDPNAVGTEAAKQASDELDRRQEQARIAAEQRQQMREARAAERAARRAQAALTGEDTRSIIDRFNDEHDTEALLVQYGYEQHPHRPDRWRSPMQIARALAERSTNKPTYPLRIHEDGGWDTLSGTDLKAGIGKPIGDDGARCGGDAFDMFAFHEHANDRKAAIRGYAAAAGITLQAPQTVADIAQFKAEARPEGMPATVGLSTAPKRYILQTADEFLSKPPVSWFLRHVLPRNGVQVVYGPSRAGKTFVVLDLVLSLLDDSREDWFGYDIRNRPSGAVYLAMEGAYGVRARVKAWATDNGGDLPQNMLFLEGQAFNMLQIGDVDALAAAVVEHFPQGNAITVIDTQAKAAAGADEQAAKDMGLVYLAAERIAQVTGGLVMLVAHTGKDVEKGIRGSSAQTGAADGMILVTRTNANPDSANDDDTDDENEVRTWKVVKCKDGPENATGAFKLQSVVIGHDADGEEVTSAVVRETAMPKSKKRQVLGKNAKMVFDTLLELIKQTGSTQVPLLVWREAVVAKLADNPKRYQIFNRDGVKKLVESGYVDKVSDTHYAVSLGVGMALTEAQLPSANSVSAAVGV